jgi:hypothetical protein
MTSRRNADGKLVRYRLTEAALEHLDHALQPRLPQSVDVWIDPTASHREVTTFARSQKGVSG